MISPRLLFQRIHKEDAKRLATALEEAWMQKAVSYARSQMALNGASQERMAGANEFIEILTALPEEQKPPQEPPDKSALTSYA